MQCVCSTSLSPPLQISEAVYKQVLSQTQAQYEALVQACEVQTSRLDTVLRTDMDQIITSKEHVSGKIRGERHAPTEPIENTPY